MIQFVQIILKKQWARCLLVGEKNIEILTDDKDGIMDYFYEATPVQELAELNIGSRPSHRKNSKI